MRVTKVQARIRNGPENTGTTLTTPPPDTFRHRLRRDTSSAHATLDTLLSKLDLTTAEGLAPFLVIQNRALRSLAPLSTSAATSAVIRDLIDRTGADLDQLGTPGGMAPPAPSQMVDPMALDYLVAGSRLGTAVLAKRWAQATDPKVQRASAYFAGQSHLELWQSLCHQLSSMPADHCQAEKIINDSNLLFEFYTSCAKDALGTGIPVYG